MAPFSARGLLVDANQSGVEHQVFIVAIPDQFGKHFLPHAALASGKPRRHAVPLAIALRQVQVLPVGAGPRNPQPRSRTDGCRHRCGRDHPPCPPASARGSIERAVQAQDHAIDEWAIAADVMILLRLFLDRLRDSREPSQLSRAPPRRCRHSRLPGLVRYGRSPATGFSRAF